MSFLDSLNQFTGNVGRGLLDVFTLGGNELGRKFGGSGYTNIVNPIQTGLGANFEAGAVGGTGMLGAQGMGAFGAPQAASAGPQSVALNPGGPGSTLMARSGTPVQAASGPSTISSMLQASRGMPMGGMPQQPQQQNPMQVLNQLYSRYPNLRPHFGGNV